MIRQTLAVFGTLLVLWAVVSQVNHCLAPWHAYLFLGGLTVAYAALVLPAASGLCAVVGAGFVADAHSFVPFGTHALLFAGCHTALLHLRERLPHEEILGRLAIAWLCNAALFLLLSLFEMRHAPNIGVYWGRLLADFVYSQVALGLIAPWFFSFQERVLGLVRADAGRA